MRSYYDYGPMMAHNDWGYGGLIALGVFVVFLIFLVMIVLIVARLIKNHGGRWAIHRDPIDIAKERYAKGEIDKEQLEQIKNDLK